MKGLELALVELALAELALAELGSAPGSNLLNRNNRAQTLIQNSVENRPSSFLTIGGVSGYTQHTYSNIMSYSLHQVSSIPSLFSSLFHPSNINISPYLAALLLFSQNSANSSSHSTTGFLLPTPDSSLRPRQTFPIPRC